MKILILPVSGGAFPVQLAAISELSFIEYKPDITIGSSGGNVAAYIASAAEWSSHGIERIAKTLSSTLFISSWVPSPLPSLLWGFFNGAIYQKGVGVEHLLNTYFTTQTIMRDEIWTGTHNRTTQRTCLFCNKRKENSCLDIRYIDTEINLCMEPIFMNGDINLISKVGIASASIPMMVPAQKIDNDFYIDGGIDFASPLHILQGSIAAIGEHESLHLIYLNSMDLYNKKPHPTCCNIMDNGYSAASDLIRGKIIVDRATAYDFLKIGKPISSTNFPCNRENLLIYKNHMMKAKRSLLEIYPLKNNRIELNNFTGEEIANSINDFRNNMACQLWWVN